jgi:hypothetical protein
VVGLARSSVLERARFPVVSKRRPVFEERRSSGHGYCALAGGARDCWMWERIVSMTAGSVMSAIREANCLADCFAISRRSPAGWRSRADRR